MDDIRTSRSVDWVEGFREALASIQEAAGTQDALDILARSLLSVSGAGKAFGILMEKDTVIAEAACGSADRGNGDGPIDEEIRKAAARQALAAVRQAESGAPTTSVSAQDSTLEISLALEGDRAAAFRLDHLSAPTSAPEGLERAIALVVASCGLMTAGAEAALAAARATASENRVKELESSVASGGVGAVAYLKPVAELERDAIELALRTTNWNKEEAARRLGISRASIYMKVKKFGLQKPI